MKKLISSLVLTATLAAPAFADNYTNQIIQIQDSWLLGEVRYPIYNVGENGQRLAPLPILFGESEFELWSLNTSSGESRKLDTTVVNGIYSPEIVITTPDPNDTELNPRTRVDIPYSVRVAGISGSQVNTAAQELGFMVNKEPYPTGAFGFPRGYSTDFSQGNHIEAMLAGTMLAPVSVTSSFVTDDWTTARGEEKYSLWEPTDRGVDLMNEKSIEIWPTVTVDFVAGSELEDKVYESFDPVIVEISNLYAVDEWKIEIIDSNGNAETIAEGSVTGDEPQSRRVTIPNLVDELSGEGVYTLVVSQYAEGLDPSFVEHLTVSFTYNSQLTVRGHIGSSN